MKTLYQVQSDSLLASSLFSLPDDILFWTISCLRRQPVPVLEVDDIQWKQFFEVLSSHYIIPLIWFNLKRGTSSVLPPSWVMERMQGIYRDVSIRTLRTDNQITQIVNQLKKDNIFPIILKGPALGHLVYPFPALRNGSDIDILVHPDEVQVAITSLRDLGYEPHIDAHAA